jgi:acetyl/propionyl-CoA carboxylase alpha subunit
VRDDSGIYEGWEAPVYYDSLLAKLCVWAEDRESAVKRLARALDEYAIEGIRTTLDFFRAVVRNEEFRRGEFDTGFIDRFLSQERSASRSTGERDKTLADMAAIAAVLSARAGAARPENDKPREAESRWKLRARLEQRR